MKKSRPRLTEDEMTMLINYREQKSLLNQECESAGIDPKDIGHYWYKSKHFSIFARNKVVSYEEVKSDIISEMRNYAPRYPKIERVKSNDSHLLVIDPADIHIGKLSSKTETGEEYNNLIAVKRVKEGIQGILNKASGFNIDQVLFIAGNDILHIDTPKRTTTAGTPQDTDGMWYDNFLIAKQLYIDCLESLLPVADVHVQFNPSNHDFTNGFFLADVVKTWFRNCPNIHFNCDISHRKYYQYHNNLIGTTHGDGAKVTDLPLLMAQESPMKWANTKHRYIYTHHVHHKNAKDFVGVTVESLRSPSSADGWHHRNGYQHAPKAIEGFIHCPYNGQVARLTHIF